MRIGILKTGDVNPDIVARHGEYADMFVRLLSPLDDDLSFFVVDVDGGEDLGDPGQAQGWLITGSRHGVYEDHAWIAPLKQFLRDAIAASIPVVGVCFGHQILAEAMGGRVVKSTRGWGLGVHGYAPAQAPAWLSPLDRPWTAHAVHQDHVIVQPPESTVIARSDFCEFAALLYGDPDRPSAISVQAHPEFDADMVRDLIKVRLSSIVPREIVAAAESSLGGPVAAEDWARAIVTFFRLRNAGAQGPGQTFDYAGTD